MPLDDRRSAHGRPESRCWQCSRAIARFALSQRLYRGECKDASHEKWGGCSRTKEWAAAAPPESLSFPVIGFEARWPESGHWLLPTFCLTKLSMALGLRANRQKPGGRQVASAVPLRRQARCVRAIAEVTDW